jgi:hypothetical protein
LPAIGTEKLSLLPAQFFARCGRPAPTSTPFADLIEQTDGGKLSEAEMKKLYDAGYEDGRADGVRAAEAKVAHDADGFRHVSGSLSWHDMARFCQGRSARLRGKEPDFVDDMVGWTVWKEPTPKKAKWLQSIYLRLGGRP